MGESGHNGHRERMRERFLTVNGKGFAPHELLEMLLYHAIPRCDTNELAHRLMEAFGSFDGVLDAQVEDLCRVEGIGRQSAIYLKLVGEAALCYMDAKSGVRYKKDVFDTPAKIAAFLLPRYAGLSVERVYMLLFDNAMHLLDCYHVCDGTVSSVSISVRRVAEHAYRKGATAVILAHNHPGGMTVPSGEDVRLTRRMEQALRLLEVPLLEHYIFTERSFAPIMNRCPVGQESSYAASSLVEVLRRQLSEGYRWGDE